VNPPLTLVVLAAGLGTRYGGLKQLDRLGPGGATLMDYSVFDGWRAGFSRVVFVIRPASTSAFAEAIGDRYRGRLAIELVEQRLDDLPPGSTLPPTRSRPWGTAQAMLSARPWVPGAFAVLNADDFYGRAALDSIAGFLRLPSDQHAVVGYPLGATASPVGGVNRALLEYTPEHLLLRITELHDLRVRADGGFGAGPGDGARLLTDDVLVSMNLWGFRPAIFPIIASTFSRFLAAEPGDDGECYLPEAVQSGLATAALTVRVLPTTSRWCGITHPADREWVAATLRALVERGDYPEVLW
jgi:hypothetical protein